MSMPAPQHDPARDPSRGSYYVTDALYREVVEAFANWQRDDRAVEDAAERDRFRQLIEREARLLDQDRLEDWLNLFARECIYWLPTTPHAGDPRREVTITLDDRRRLEDRVFRLRTGFAWSQAPQSRTVRSVSNVEVFATGRDDTRMVRSTFLISEFREGETRLWSGWSGHRLVSRNGRWEIVVKQVNLIDCDQNLRNPSIIL